VSSVLLTRNIKSAYSETWNISVDRQIGPGVVSLAYAGSRGLHLYDIANVNPAGGGGFILVMPMPLSPNLQYSNMNSAAIRLQPLQCLECQVRGDDIFSRGLGLAANYTGPMRWITSLHLQRGNGATSSGAYQLGYLDAFNPQLNYRQRGFWTSHAFPSVDLELPWMKSSGKGLPDRTGGWARHDLQRRTAHPSASMMHHRYPNSVSAVIPNQAVPTSGSSVAAEQTC